MRLPAIISVGCVGIGATLAPPHLPQVRALKSLPLRSPQP
jgi:hypothetical protein